MKKVFSLFALLFLGYGSSFAQDLAPIAISYNWDFQTAIISNLEIEVENASSFSVLSDYRIEVYIDGIGTTSCLGSNYLVDWFNVGSISGNSTKIYSLPNIDVDNVDNTCGLPTGTYHLRVVVDVDDDVSESDENNNETSFTNATFDFESLAVAVEDGDRLEQIKLYPNPAQGHFIVDQSSFMEDVQMEIISIDGRVLRSETISAQQSNTQVNIEDLQPGLYLVKFIRDGEQSTQKLLVQ